ncbi:hypothetical protein Vafri_16592 [Volvox africanus]|uniref:NADH-ubiquinone oxidoreductase 21kDa subunit N-terminal domain-containing protein n=1 Tax=Volvox africanus TaxID=51714 RepID=A0A8J4BK50_9CHLO|nr:hypothetical protein Vafri_16592 [Volvox africanus]
MVWPEPPNYYEAPKHGFKVTLETPQYPIINPEPSISDALTNMRSENWSAVAGLAAFGYVAGYFFGSKVHWAKPTALFTSVFLGKTGLLWGMSDSAHRLMGFKENSKEIAGNMPHVMQREAY